MEGVTIMVDAALEQPPADLYERISDRAALGPSCDFWVLYGGKPLEGDAALSSWGVKQGAEIEVKLRGRGAGKGFLPASWPRVSLRRGTGHGESSRGGVSSVAESSVPVVPVAATLVAAASVAAAAVAAASEAASSVQARACYSNVVYDHDLYYPLAPPPS